MKKGVDFCRISYYCRCCVTSDGSGWGGAVEGGEFQADVQERDKMILFQVSVKKLRQEVGDLG